MPWQHSNHDMCKIFNLVEFLIKLAHLFRQTAIASTNIVNGILIKLPNLCHRTVIASKNIVSEIDSGFDNACVQGNPYHPPVSEIRKPCLHDAMWRCHKPLNQWQPRLLVKPVLSLVKRFAQRRVALVIQVPGFDISIMTGHIQICIKVPYWQCHSHHSVILSMA